MVATLNLGTGYRTAVYQVVKAALEADPVYGQAGVQLLWYDGDPEAISDLDGVQQPCLQFFPTAGNMAWFDESSQAGALVVGVEARLLALDVEDVFNLQEALEDTLNTINDPGGLQADLVSAGAVTGLILFTQPLKPVASGKPGSDNLFRLQGQFVVEVRRPLA